MDVLEAIIAIEKGWTEIIIPAITNRRYVSAHNDVLNLSLTALSSAREFGKYHNGIKWMTHISLLAEAIDRRNEKDIQEYTQSAQAYLSQLSLSIKTSNIF